MMCQCINWSHLNFVISQIWQAGVFLFHIFYADCIYVHPDIHKSMVTYVLIHSQMYVHIHIHHIYTWIHARIFDEPRGFVILCCNQTNGDCHFRSVSVRVCVYYILFLFCLDCPWVSKLIKYLRYLIQGPNILQIPGGWSLTHHKMSVSLAGSVKPDLLHSV